MPNFYHQLEVEDILVNALSDADLSRLKGVYLRFQEFKRNYFHTTLQALATILDFNHGPAEIDRFLSDVALEDNEEIDEYIKELKSGIYGKCDDTFLISVYSLRSEFQDFAKNEKNTIVGISRLYIEKKITFSDVEIEIKLRMVYDSAHKNNMEEFLVDAKDIIFGERFKPGHPDKISASLGRAGESASAVNDYSASDSLSWSSNRKIVNDKNTGKERLQNAAEFIAEHFSDRLASGTLTVADVRNADDALGQAYMRYVRNHKSYIEAHGTLPEGFAPLALGQPGRKQKEITGGVGLPPEQVGPHVLREHWRAKSRRQRQKHREPD